MRRIVCVLGNYKNGGIAMRATNLANEFANNGYLVDILVTGEISEVPFFKVRENVNIVLLKDYYDACKSSTNNANRRAIIHILKKIRFITKLISSVDKRIERRISFLRSGEKLRHYFINKPNTVVIAFGIPYIKGVLSATEGLDCKVIYAEKNAPEMECPIDSDGFNEVISLLKSSYAVIVQTHDIKDYYSKYLDTVEVINNPIVANLPLPHTGIRSKRIINFCRISEQKNLELLLYAFQRLHIDYPGYYVEIYGNIVYESEKLYKEKVMKKAEDMGLRGYFRILPPAADVHNRILDAAMFVSSSDYEGLSNSMIEAMAIGLPCICTDCLGGGTREIMVDHENGLIVPMNDPESLYSAMKEFIDNPELAKKCSQNALKIKKKLDVKKIAAQWLEVIERN